MQPTNWYTNKYKTDPAWAEKRRAATAKWRSENGYDRQRSYGLTKEQYEAMLEGQGYLCCICQQKKPLAVDHCHKTSKIRGLLCGSCNRGVGLLGDDAERLRAAASYVEQNV